MNERPTPETDAFVREYANADPARARDAMTDKHRRLERQRDLFAELSMDALQQVQRLIIQRDELLEAAENLENDNGAIPEHAWIMLQAAIPSVKGGGK